MYPSADLLAELARDVGLRGTGVPSFPSLCLSDVDLADTLIRAHRQCEDDPDPVAAEGSVVEVLSTLLRRHALGPGARSEDGAPIRATQRVVEYLHECFADRITLGGVAQTVGLSRYAVLRVFRRDVGIPPYGFLTQIRVEQAKNLLRTGQSLAAVAQMVGFADQSHLTRHFRRLVGVTPGAFARAVRAA
jgi:AraC-like DNA-binding protein